MAAAGNQKSELSADITDDTETMFPALYGGESEPRVITVMATDGEGKRAAFSNWGSNFVDIAAPGCKVPALTWDEDLGRFVETAESGTSLSAPLVAFTAALIRSESGGEFSPIEIKRRILVSADLAPESLLSQSADARRLNIPKAVALRTDVVESGKRLIFGTVRLLENKIPLRLGDGFSLECERKKDLRFQPERILKIARWLPTPDGTSLQWMVYSRTDNPRQLFTSDICKIPSKVTLDVRKPTTGVVESLDWKDITDVVMRYTGP